MNEFKENLKVDLKENHNIEKDRTINLILQYIEKEKEENRRFDEEDGIDVYAEDYKPEAGAIIMMIENMLKYRELRVEQAYISKMNMGNNSREFREKATELDKDRREKHNLALTSLKGLNEFAKKYNLEPIYEGRVLTDEQIDSHDKFTYDIREEMTDAFLKMLIELGNFSMEKAVNSKEEIMKLQRRIDKTERKYGVKRELEHDDGDIEFKDVDDELQM